MVALTLGAFERPDKEYAATRDAGWYVHDRARRLLYKAMYSRLSKRLDIRVKFATVADLGFPDGDWLVHIYGSRFAHGRELVPADAILSLCLAPPVMLWTQKKGSLWELDQRGGNEVYLAMRPIVGALDTPYIFAIVRPFGGKLIYAEPAHPHSFFGPKALFAFSA